MQLLCKPFHQGALPCYYNGGSLNHLQARWGNSELQSPHPHEDNGQRQQAMNKQSPVCLAAQCWNTAPVSLQGLEPWRRCLPVPGLSALLYKDGIDLCRPHPRLVQSHRAPWLWQSWALPRPWGGAGLSSRVCVSVCPSVRCQGLWLGPSSASGGWERLQSCLG